MIKHFMSKQFMLFLMTGGIAAGINFCSRIIYNQWVDFSMAVVLAYITGMVSAFILAKIFVFTQHTQPIHHSIFFFTLVNLAAVAQTWVISMGLAYYLLPLLGVTFFPLEIAHGIGISIPVFTSYLGHKYWSFR